MLEAGDSYLVPTNIDQEGYEKHHLYIILLDAEEYTSNTIIAPINTLKSDKQDKTVLLLPNAHDFIVNVSFVNYHRAEIQSVKHIERLIDSKVAKQNQKFKNDILQRIVDGVRKSKHTPNEVLIMYSNYMYRKLEKKG